MVSRQKEFDELVDKAIQMLRDKQAAGIVAVISINGPETLEGKFSAYARNSAYHTLGVMLHEAILHDRPIAAGDNFIEGFSVCDSSEHKIKMH